MDRASNNLMQLRPVTFHYKEEHDPGEGRLQFGLIAEEVAEVYPELVVYDDRGKVKTVEYQKLPAMLLNETPEAKPNRSGTGGGHCRAERTVVPAGASSDHAVSPGSPAQAMTV